MKSQSEMMEEELHQSFNAHLEVEEDLEESEEEE